MNILSAIIISLAIIMTGWFASMDIIKILQRICDILDRIRDRLDEINGRN